MADIPEDIICPDLPSFTNVGVDYFGPIEVKRGRALVKRYGVIFTCIKFRGCLLPRYHFLYYCHQEVHVLQRLSIKIKDALLQKGIDWMFNRPSGSHHGGAWECLIRMVIGIGVCVIHRGVCYT
ncbi:hypothetical protein N1851_030827 [Merluccius polli]|uniref:Uncharacterized protein n=1 Tax=Merluccius polli TaxID=89951 RepID=A0AA47NQI3_MERPO|nr:hypothetical protein N1851_030827 [Merluccius polli]